MSDWLIVESFTSCREARLDVKMFWRKALSGIVWGKWASAPVKTRIKPVWRREERPRRRTPFTRWRQWRACVAFAWSSLIRELLHGRFENMFFSPCKEEVPTTGPARAIPCFCYQDPCDRFPSVPKLWYFQASVVTTDPAEAVRWGDYRDGLLSHRLSWLLINRCTWIRLKFSLRLTLECGRSLDSHSSSHLHTKQVRHKVLWIS